MIKTDTIPELQVRMMAAWLYEIGLFRPVNLGGATGKHGPEMLTRVWDIDAILKSLPWLRLQNSLGRNIYIRPKGEHHLSLVDDLKWSNIEWMKAAGFRPAIIVQTSPGNFQAWLNHGRVLPKELSSVVAKRLAERFDADIKAAAWRQYGRLAGFTNRKDKHRQSNGLFPYVKLVEATTRVYEKAEEFLASISGEMAQAKAEAVRRKQILSTGGNLNKSANLKTIEHFKQKPQYAGDGSRIDLAYAVYALSHGVPEDDVRRTIAGRDLSKKGTELRQRQYIDRTIAKAFAGVGLSR